MLCEVKYIIYHGESRVYHQFQRNCISSRRSLVYHHCESFFDTRWCVMIYSPDGLMRYNDSKAIVGDIPLLSQGIKKFDLSKQVEFFGVRKGTFLPSCGSRKNLRAAAYPRFFRPLRQNLLPASAAGGGRRFCPRRTTFGFKSISHNQQKATP